MSACIPCAAAAANPIIGLGLAQPEFPMLNLVIFIGILIGVSVVARTTKTVS